MMRTLSVALVLAVAIVMAGYDGVSVPARAQVEKPAAATEARTHLDLSKLALVPGSKPVARSMASLTYQAPGTVKGVYAFHQKQLRDAQWEEKEGSMVEEAAGSGMFQRAGFVVSLSVYPGTEAGQAQVVLIQHGNVDVSKLPVPEGAKVLYVLPTSAMFVSEQTPEQASGAIAGMLRGRGWEPYGAAGDVRYYKKVCILLSARVAAAQAQGGKTMIEYSSMLMSADLPAPADALAVQYSDIPTQISVDLNGTVEDVADYYRKALGVLGWKETTENPIKDSFEFFWIFRNPAQEMVELQIQDLKGKTRTVVRYRTAEQAEAMLKQAREGK